MISVKFTVKWKVPPKAIIGVLILVIAFVFFLVNYTNDDELIDIVEDNNIGEEIENSNQEADSVIEDTIVVEIAGEVNNPSVYILIEGSRLYEAIELAGGLTDQADIRNTNMASVLRDEMKVYIPT